MDDVVVCALQECRIDRNDGPHTTRRQAGGESDGMALGDADVEKACWMRLREQICARTTWHGRGDRDDTAIFGTQFGEPFAEHLLVRRGRRRGVAELSSRRVVIGWQRVPLLETLARWKSLSFLRADVDESWTAEITDRGERLDHRIDVVTVDWSEIPEPKLLEQDARREERLETLFPAPHPGPEANRREETAGAIVGQISDRRSHAVIQ